MRLQHKHILTSRQLVNLSREIKREVRAAEEAFPQWPNDISLGVMIMAEEAGEAIRADVQRVWQDRLLGELRLELVQTAAMCIRLLGDSDERVEARSCPV